MPDYTDLPDTAVGIGGVPSGTTVTALRDNPLAIAERATGAPLVVGATQDILARTVISGTPSTVNFTFDGTNYDEIIFRLANIVPATDGANLWLRTSTNGGSTYDSGAANYDWVAREASMQTAPSDALTGDNADAQIVLANGIGSGSGEDGVFGEVRIFAPSLAKKTSVFADLSWRDILDNGATTVLRGTRLSSSDVNAVRFLLSSGNFENGGIISMYGIRNL